MIGARAAGTGLLALRSLGYEPVGVVAGVALGQRLGPDLRRPLSPTSGLEQVPFNGRAVRPPDEALSVYPCGHDPAVHPPGYNELYAVSGEHVARSFDDALGQVVRQARSVGAHGVVGIRVDEEHVAMERGGHGALSWKLTGTAVRSSIAVDGEPIFTTSLSEPELLTLDSAGYRPVRLALGQARVLVSPGCPSFAVPRTDGTAESGQFADAHRQALQEAFRRLTSRTETDLVVNLRTTPADPLGPWWGSVACQIVGDLVRRSGRARRPAARLAFSLGPTEPPGPAAAVSASSVAALASLGMRPDGPIAGAGAVVAPVVRAKHRSPGELAELGAAVDRACQLAIDRTAAAAAADGVLGVIDATLAVEYTPSQNGVMVGAVVRGVAVASRRRSKRAAPFVAGMSASDLCVLQAAGFAPVTLVAGAAVWNRSWQPTPTSAWVGGEAGAAVEARTTARHLALARLSAAANRRGVAGVLAVGLTERSEVWGRRSFECRAVGTAIVGDGPGSLPAPDLYLALEG